ncbi:MAG: serine/threonine protein kinase [Phycisphaerales bacterium]|nr:serine/threonine protein kinase [Phycisphaerales bacterium]
MQPAPGNWETVKRLVAEVIDLPTAERAGYLAAQTGADASLRSEVESLVSSSESSAGVLSPALDAWVGFGRPELGALDGQRIGRYRLERLLAEGATAAVYEATQAAPARRVALKLLREPLPLVEASGRFAREAAALGRLEHPHIARIYEAGVHRTAAGAGLPFIAMEYIEGLPINTAARVRSLGQGDRLRLMIKVARAVHAAHQQAIIHRDLKPANILVDAAGEPHVLDFGIARITGGTGDYDIGPTAAGMLLGTPGYMSPEQALGRADEIDVRTDVWALGALLYELLTGRLPIEIRGATLHEALQRIERAEPAPPSRVARGIAADLDLIVTTALAREKQRRYASAQALSEDLERCLRNEPIAARPATLRYRVVKFARRHRTGLFLIAGFIVLVAAAGVSVTRAWIRADREHARAAAVNTLLRNMISAADPHYGDRHVTMAAVLASAERRIDQTPGLTPDVEAGVRSALGTLYFGLGDYDRARELLERGIALRKPLVGESDPDLLADQARLAIILRWQYEPEQARLLASQVHKRAHHALGAGHLTTLIAAETLAGCLLDLDQLGAAEEAYRDILTVCRRHWGDRHAQTLTTLGNLAVVLTAQGRYAEAEVLTQEALAARLVTGGPHTLDAITLRGNLAGLMAEQGRLEAAIAALRAVVADAAKYLGESHEHTLEQRASLAEFLHRAGASDEALAETRTIFERRVESNGWGHDRTLSACGGYAAMLLRLKQYDDAHALAQRAVQETERALGADHLWHHRSRLTLAAALCGLGDVEQARAVYADAIAALEAALGPTHAQTLVAWNNYGLCLAESGDGDAAIAVLEPTLVRVIENSFEAMVPVVRRNLGHALLVAGRFTEAEMQLCEAYEQSLMRGEHENARRAAALLASLCTSLDRASDAATWHSRTWVAD